MSSAGLFLLRGTSGTLMRMRAARVGRWWHVGRRWEKKCDFLHVSLSSRPSRSTLTDGKRQLPSCPRLHLKQLAHRVVSAGLPVGSTAGTIQMMPHLRNIKELEQPRGQPTEQTKPTQTTRKGWGGGADERQLGLSLS